MSIHRYLAAVGAEVLLMAAQLVLGAESPGAGPPRNPRCEYRVDPLGIDEKLPRLSWELDDTRRGAAQSAYQVLVSRDANALAKDQGPEWDSGKVKSDQSIHIAYGGKPVESGCRYHWKVRVWDHEGKVSPWSEPALWSMGPLSPSDWKAMWIGRDETPGRDTADDIAILKKAQWIWFPEGEPAVAAPPGTRYFRRTFTVPQNVRVERAEVVIAADNSLALFINGRTAGTRSGFQQAGILDITDHVRPGANAVAIAATNAGESPNPAGMIGFVRIRPARGEPTIIPTDAEWKVADGETPAWQTAEFQDAEWAAAKPLGKHGMAPWGEIGVGGDESRRLPARMLRREFTAHKKVRRATAYVCGLGYYEFHLNGAKVGDHVLDPGLTDYSRRALYVTYDVTARLIQGTNAVGVILGNGRYFAPRGVDPFKTVTYGYPQLLFQMHVEYDDGTATDVISDDTWKLTCNGPIRANNDYDGEEYDARKEIPGWNRAGLDDARWEPARPVDAPGGVLAPQMADPIRVTRTIQPVMMTSPRPGTYVYDMGQNMVGWVRLAVRGPRGTKVTLRFAETLADDGTLYLANMRGAKVTDTYVLKGRGIETYEPRFTYHGFRYVELRGFPGEPTLSTIEGRVVHSSVERAGSFSCSNALLNRIYSNILWGVRGNLRSIPTDCPQRDERQGWLGDIANESKAESFDFHVAPFFAKWLTDIQDAQNNEGSIPDVAPAFWAMYSDNITWPSAYVIIPSWFHEQYADTRVLEAHYPSIRKWLDFMGGFLVDGIMPRDTYGDWCVPPESPQLIHSQDPARKTAGDLLATAYYHHDLRLAARYAAIIGKADEAKQLEERAAKVNDAFQKKFFNEQTGQYDNGSQTSSVLPLAFGMVPPQHRQAVFDGLVKNILVTNNGHIATGLIGGQWLMRVLSDNGRADIALRIATNTSYPSWGYMVEKGATTIWELWNGDTADPAMNSGNHLMLVGDLGIWFYEYLGGIRSDPEHPGFKRILIRPHPLDGLDWVRCEYPSMHGRVRSAWWKKEGRVFLEVTVPPNTTARVCVPTLGMKEPAIREGESTVVQAGKAADSVPGVKFVQMEADGAVFEVAAGQYRFVVEPS